MYRSTRMWARQISTAIANLFWPGCCVICQRPGQFGLDLCHACESMLPALTRTSGKPSSSDPVESLCVICGSCVTVSCRRARDPTNACDESLIEPQTRAIRCEACRDATLQFADVVSPYRFDFPMNQLIHRLKYQHRRELARVFGTLLARAALKQKSGQGADSLMPELLLPVPAHPDRFASRDFNQAADLSRWCASELGLRSVPGWAQRIVDTPSLAGLSRSERQLCIRGAFAVHPGVADRHVAIVDDVLTSGATTGELARELLDSGAASVQLWVLARTAAEGSSSSRRNRSGTPASADSGKSLAQSAW